MALPAGSGTRKGSRLPSALNVGIGVLLVALIVPLALSASQQAPPAVAEFAPQAFQLPKNNHSTSSFGLGDQQELGQQAVGLPTPTPTPAPSSAPIEGNKVKQCVGGLQIPDPQSPACIPYWVGNNGGTTYPKGVTGTEIDVAWGFGDAKLESDLQDYFNNHFELYGRQVKFVPGIGNPFGGEDAQSQQQDAAYVDEESHAFASLNFQTGAYGGQEPYYDELARRGIIGANSIEIQWTEQDLANHQPFEWGTLASLDKQERYLADFVCTTLAKKPPRLAPPQPSITYPAGPPTRRFAVITGKSASGATPMPDSSILVDGMSGCGAAPVYQAQIDASSGLQAEDEQASSIMLNVAKYDVTSILCICQATDITEVLMPAADNQSRHPEWVINNFGGQDDDAGMELGPSDQLKDAFGVSWQNKTIPMQSTTWWQAIHEVDPTYTTTQYNVVRDIWTDVLMVFSGLEYAGPDLTPQTFQQGLFRASFPNTTTGQAPYWEATVGFSPGDHTEYQDVALVWWNPSLPNTPTTSGTGGYCSIANGRRFAIGGFPTTDQAFVDKNTC